jgi:hypothetical protein
VILVVSEDVETGVMAVNVELYVWETGTLAGE